MTETPARRLCRAFPLIWTGCLLVLLPVLTLADEISQSQDAPRIAIIIDDIGYNYSLGKKAIDLPGAITYAVLPFSPNGRRLAEYAYHQQKELMLHLPMESHEFDGLDKGGLTEGMSRDEFIQTVEQDLASIPHIRGVNNHMGSLLTTRQPQMDWLMGVLKSRNLFFIDSKTSSESVALKSARKYGVPHRARHVFLDNERNALAINRRFNELLTLARKQGFAIAIGHPHRKTTDYLAQVIPLLEEAGIELVPASQLIPLAEDQQLAANQHPAPEISAPPQEDCTSSEAGNGNSGSFCSW